ncbi:MAG: hypothetical protein ACR2O2_17000 [Ruegeria sp.]
MTPPPRLHVLIATGSDHALILRRGPSDETASILWNRSTGQIQLGQWLKGRIHEYRCDISPDGRHMVYFACRGGRCWTAVSRAPWLRAIAYWPQSSSWHGGGAFTDDGLLWLNGAQAPSDLPDGLRPADQTAFPHSTDGFHMGDLFAAQMQRRGWEHARHQRYDAELQTTVSAAWNLRLTFETGAKNRALISNRYALVSADNTKTIDLPGWQWADKFGPFVQWSENGALWQATIHDDGTLEDRTLLHDLSDMQFQAIAAPYPGVAEREDT